MRKISIMLIFMLGCAIAALGAGRAEFIKKSHDFGTIHASGGQVTATYEFTNTGDAPISIVTVTNGGCGCTKPSYPLEPIAPGKKGVITVKFDPRSFKGEFNRGVKVKFSSGKSRTKLTFSGVIIP